MTSQTGQQIMAVHILPNISRSKGNQKMKFCQLMEYKTRIIFLKYRTPNVVKKLVSDPIKKIKIEHISGSTVWNVVNLVFIGCPS